MSLSFPASQTWFSRNCTKSYLYTAAFGIQGLHPEGLTAENLLLTPSDQGVYHLHRNGALVYVGKADNLRKRLSEHRFKIMGRQNIELAEMSFACVTIHPNWTTLAP
jgi:hypothetical protein